jgi:hypothetical protein
LTIFNLLIVYKEIVYLKISPTGTIVIQQNMSVYVSLSRLIYKLFTMMNRINLLILTAGAIMIGAFVFLIPNWLISSILFICSIILFITNRLFKNVLNKRKNVITISIWIVAFFYGYQFTKRVILHVEGQPDNVYIITGVKNQPAIHSIWKWSNHANVDTSYVVYTSSSLSQLRNIIVVDQNGKEISGYGKSTCTQMCLPNSSLIGVQTKYFKYEDGFNENDKGWVLSDYQKSKCK